LWTRCWYWYLQDYIRDLEKEEEEQKKIQKVPVYLCCNFFSSVVFSYLIFLSLNKRNNWDGLKGKIVMNFANCWKNMLLLAPLQLKLTGLTTVWRCHSHLFLWNTRRRIKWKMRGKLYLISGSELVSSLFSLLVVG
jgi:hypothetical protein